eukprot:jgi/Botrbrau1/4120/Bobra.152_3s0066.1
MAHVWSLFIVKVVLQENAFWMPHWSIWCRAFNREEGCCGLWRGPGSGVPDKAYGAIMVRTLYAYGPYSRSWGWRDNRAVSRPSDGREVERFRESQMYMSVYMRHRVDAAASLLSPPFFCLSITCGNLNGEHYW